MKKGDNNMIKNIVFDLGRVLVDFYPIPYMEQLGLDDETINKLNEIIFKSQDWVDYDSGILLHNTDIIKKLTKEHPELEGEIKLVLQDDWVKVHRLREDMANYLISLKKQGYNIYILSNISIDSYEFVSKYDFFNYIDGGVYSYEVKVSKPNELIYKTLLQRYNLIPEETIFIDDSLKNIEMAQKIGINAIQHIDIDQTKRFINELL